MCVALKHQALHLEQDRLLHIVFCVDLVAECLQHDLSSNWKQYFVVEVMLASYFPLHTDSSSVARSWFLALSSCGRMKHTISRPFCRFFAAGTRASSRGQCFP